MREGRTEGQNLMVVRENYLNGDELENGLSSSCGSVNHPSMAVVTYSGEEVKESELLIVHPLTVVDE